MNLLPIWKFCSLTIFINSIPFIRPCTAFQTFVRSSKCINPATASTNKLSLVSTTIRGSPSITKTFYESDLCIRKNSIKTRRFAVPEQDIEIDDYDDDEDDEGDADDNELDDELTDDELLSSAGNWDERIPRYNTIHVTGRIGSKNDPKYFNDGKVVISVSIASKRTYNNMERKLLSLANDDIKEEIDATDWYECEVWGQKAEFISKFADIGARVSVVGDLQIDTWNDKDTGEFRAKPKIRVRDFELLESKAEADLRRKERSSSPSTTSSSNSYNSNKKSYNSYQREERGKSFWTSDDDDDDNKYSGGGSNGRPSGRGFFDL